MQPPPQQQQYVYGGMPPQYGHPQHLAPPVPHHQMTMQPRPVMTMPAPAPAPVPAQPSVTKLPTSFPQLNEYSLSQLESLVESKDKQEEFLKKVAGVAERLQAVDTLEAEVRSLQDRGGGDDDVGLMEAEVASLAAAREDLLDTLRPIRVRVDELKRRVEKQAILDMVSAQVADADKMSKDVVHKLERGASDAGQFVAQYRASRALYHQRRQKKMYVQRMTPAEFSALF